MVLMLIRAVPDDELISRAPLVILRVPVPEKFKLAAMNSSWVLDPVTVKLALQLKLDRYCTRPPICVELPR